MKLMQDMMKQMQTAKPREGMTAQQMREWIDEHMKLMDQLMGQMMDGVSHDDDDADDARAGMSWIAPRVTLGKGMR